jgi:enoyl-CoA hydratase/carnithine racemase
MAADIVVAVDDARFMDHHLGMGKGDPYGPPYGFVPGDGGLSLAPLFFSPPVAKEFLMLAREFTGQELADRGAINYAVGADEIDAKVAELAKQLLARPAYPLAWAKRVANKHVVQQLNLTLDAGVAYQMVGMAQLEMQEWVDRLRLDDEP